MSYAVEIARNTALLRNPLDEELFRRLESAALAAISVFKESVESLFKGGFRIAYSIVEKAKP